MATSKNLENESRNFEKPSKPVPWHHEISPQLSLVHHLHPEGQDAAGWSIFEKELLAILLKQRNPSGENYHGPKPVMLPSYHLTRFQVNVRSKRIGLGRNPLNPLITDLRTINRHPSGQTLTFSTGLNR